MSSKNSETPLKDRIDWVTVIGCIKERSRHDPFYPWRYLRPVLSCRRSLCLPAIPVSGIFQIRYDPPRETG